MKNNKSKKNIGKLTGNAIFWLIVIALVFAFGIGNNLLMRNVKKVDISNVISRANSGEIEKLEIQGNEISVTPKGEKRPTERTVKENGTIYEQGLKQGKTVVEVKPVDNSGDYIKAK